MHPVRPPDAPPPRPGVTLLLGKVLSPQVLPWLVPAAPLGGGASWRWTLAAALITLAYDPYLYDFVADGARWAVALPLARNAALVGAGISAPGEPWGSRQNLASAARGGASRRAAFGLHGRLEGPAATSKVLLG